MPNGGGGVGGRAVLIYAIHVNISSENMQNDVVYV